MQYWSRRKATQWHTGRIPLSNRETLPDILGLGHQGFFHTDGQQPTIGQGADSIHCLRSSGCEFILLISGVVVCPLLSIALPLFFSVQWWEPLWGHEPPRHLWELWDGLPHTFPGVHRWQLEWNHEGNWDLEARISYLWGKRNSDMWVCSAELGLAKGWRTEHGSWVGVAR